MLYLLSLSLHLYFLLLSFFSSRIRHLSHPDKCRMSSYHLREHLSSLLQSPYRNVQCNKKYTLRYVKRLTCNSTVVADSQGLWQLLTKCFGCSSNHSTQKSKLMLLFCLRSIFKMSHMLCPVSYAILRDSCTRLQLFPLFLRFTKRFTKRLISRNRLFPLFLNGNWMLTVLLSHECVQF